MRQSSINGRLGRGHRRCDPAGGLLTSSKEALDTVVASTLAAYPVVSEREFRAFLSGRARAVQSITSYLLAHMTFLEAIQPETVTTLASNTLAHHLADAATKPQVVALFQGIAAAIVTNAGTEELRTVIRKSPLSPATVAQVRSWLDANAASLLQVADTTALLVAIYPVVSPQLVGTNLRSISDQKVVPQMLAMWIAGRPFFEIHEFLRSQNIRYSGDHVTIENVVAMCESAFGYDLAMLVATMADLTEENSPGLSNLFGFLQRQIKCGLTSNPAIAFYESGFADRALAIAMATTVPSVAQRSDVRQRLWRPRVV